MAQQFLDLGTTANDRTGTKWRAGGDIINDNFTELYNADLEFEKASTNVVKINSLADFPDPVGGVIELTNGVDIAYEIAATNIDIGSNVFSVTGGSLVIRGLHRTASRITSNSVLDLFTVTNGAFFLEFLAITHPNGDYILNFTSTAGFNSVVFQNLIATSCKSIARIDGAFTSSLRTVTSVTTTVGGIDWVGTNNNQINCTNFLGIGAPVGWTGTLLNLGSATFNLIVFTNDNRWISPAGTTILSGLANNGNLNAGGRALVRGSIFNGAGTALSGITTQDTQWLFQGNIFVDGTTQNTRVAVNSFLDGTSQTVNNSGVSAGVYILMDQNGTDWDSNKALHFTQAANGVVTYIGIDAVDVYVNAFSTVEKSGGGADKICTKIAIDTGSGFVVQDETIGCTQNAAPSQVTSAGYFTLSTDDEIAIFCANISNATDIIASEATMLINEIM